MIFGAFSLVYIVDFVFKLSLNFIKFLNPNHSIFGFGSVLHVFCMYFVCMYFVWINNFMSQILGFCFNFGTRWSFIDVDLLLHYNTFIDSNAACKMSFDLFNVNKHHHWFSWFFLLHFDNPALFSFVEVFDFDKLVRDCKIFVSSKKWV